MKANNIFIFIFVGAFICFTTPEFFAQKITVWNELNKKELFQSSSDKFRIVHFFATWCKPCMKELPIFDSLSTLYSKEKVEMTFVCMDLKNSKKLKKQLLKLNLPGELYFLEPSEKNILSIHSKWKGSLPASILIPPNTLDNQLIEGSKTVSFYRKLIEK